MIFGKEANKMYDVVFIGAGPGGYVGAIKAAQLGKNVAVIEKSYLGGTCTNKGCIPTKALLGATHLFSEIKEKGTRLGVLADNLSYDVGKIFAHMNANISASRKGIEYLFKKNKITLYKDEAEVISKNRIKLKNKGEEIETENLVIATGSSPSLFPPFSEVDGIWTSDDVFTLKDVPEVLLIVGGGVIGCEMATFFARLGVEVYIFEIMEHILPTEDKDTADVIKKSLKKLGVKIYESSKVVDVKRKDSWFSVHADTPDGEIDIDVEKVLVSVGRRANISDDIKGLGLKIERGIVTDTHMKTNIPGVYAIGDVRGAIMLAHTAMYEGVTAAYNIAGIDKEMDYSAVPSVVFTSPEIGSVGVREKDIEADKVKIGKFPFMANGKARVMLERDGFVKVIVDKETEKVIGFTIVGPNATDLIMEGVIAVRNRLKLDELLDSIHPHPTLSEAILGALEEAEGKAIHM